MEKSRSRHTARRHPLIIDRPDLQTWPQRAVSGTLTTLFWLMWLALWMPLVTLAGWVAFGWRFKIQMFDLGGLEGFRDLIVVYAAVIAAMSGALMSWARYNYLRFRGVERRRQIDSVSLQALAAFAGQHVDTMQAWRRMRVMVAHHDVEGRVAAVIDRLAGAHEPPSRPRTSAFGAAALPA